MEVFQLHKYLSFMQNVVYFRVYLICYSHRQQFGTRNIFKKSWMMSNSRVDFLVMFHQSI